ncbi:MAG: hypothetical protein HY293_08025 [Planctomycetes bacterium]|nr:hypothetical protein [Planctomycetota bacterium]
MKRFTREDLHSYLKALDGHASEASTLVIIGGAAAILSYGAQGGTIDIDTANSVAALGEAAEAAGRETGLAIPLGRASVFDAPCGYESRLQRLKLPGLRHLRVLLPEKHDWALMKVVRFEDKDAEHIKTAAAAVGFDRKILEERFLSEMTQVMPRERLIIRFLAMMEELYGEEEADRLQQVIQAHRHWQ